MAEKRMFARFVINSDKFLDLPASSQALYFHLGMQADDDGFVGNPKRLSAFIGGSPNDLELLEKSGFIITFESGVIVIVHFLVNNYLRSDRYKPTQYRYELSLLETGENKTYMLKSGGIPNVYQKTTQSKSEKKRKEKIRGEEKGGMPTPLKNISETNKEALLKSLDENILTGKYENVSVSKSFLEKFKRKYKYADKVTDSLSYYKKAKNADYCDDEAVLDKWAEEDRGKYASDAESTFDLDDFYEAALKYSMRESHGPLGRYWKEENNEEPNGAEKDSEKDSDSQKTKNPSVSEPEKKTAKT